MRKTLLSQQYLKKYKVAMEKKKRQHVKLEMMSLLKF